MSLTAIEKKPMNKINSQLLAELGGILGSAKGINKTLKSGNGGGYLEDSRNHRLSGIFLAVDEVSPRTRQGFSGLEILKTHSIYF